MHQEPGLSTSSPMLVIFVLLLFWDNSHANGCEWSRVIFSLLCFGCLNHKVIFRRALCTRISVSYAQNIALISWPTSKNSSPRNVCIKRSFYLENWRNQHTDKIFLGPCSPIHGERIRQHSLWSRPACVWFGAVETPAGPSIMRACPGSELTGEKGARLASLSCSLLGALWTLLPHFDLAACVTVWSQDNGLEMSEAGSSLFHAKAGSPLLDLLWTSSSIWKPTLEWLPRSFERPILISRCY